jgi:undecaprenyl pyrophosphate phosphatase UppP
VVATLAAAAAVKLFVSYLTKHGLEFFAYYRIVFALVLTVLFLI